MMIPLQDATFKQLRDFVYEKCGIFVPDTKKYLLEKKLAARLDARKLHSFEEYLTYMRSSLNGDELPKLFDAVTVNETYFFREPLQLEVFVDSIMARVIELKGSRDLRLWSAACSTGEEPYTLVMMLMEKRVCNKIEIIASDLSNDVLETAKKGVYGSYSMRNVPELYLTKYFKKTGDGHEVDMPVKTLIKFMNINLADESAVRQLQGLDVIFCRNVLIYFDEKAKQKVVSLLYNALRPGGFLFIGSAESLHNVTRAFRPVIINKVIVYQRT